MVILNEIECEKAGGPPKCYSGFCENVAECVDCPTGLADMNKSGQFEALVCSGAGKCRLGWKDSKSKAGNGYCECDSPRKGLACHEF